MPSTAPPSGHDDLHRYQHFKLYRDYVEHEDALIDKRLLWNLNIQGFLLATYGFSVQKLAEVQVHQPQTDEKELLGTWALYALLFVLPLLGGVISFLSWQGIEAAQFAIKNLSDEWAEIEHGYKSGHDALKPPQPLPQLPKMTGGGAALAHDWGLRAPLWFPWAFICVWGALFAFYILLLAHFWKD
jgi:hypothetical protein